MSRAVPVESTQPQPLCHRILHQSGFEYLQALGSVYRINVGVLAAVGVNHTSDQRTYREQLEALGFDVPVTSGDHTSMFEGWWHRQCSAFTFVEDHRDRRRDYEIETLEQFDELTAHPRQVGREVEA